MIHTYVILTQPLAWFGKIAFSDAEGTRAMIAAEFAGWAPELVALIADAGTPPVQRSIYRLLDSHRWPRTPG